MSMAFMMQQRAIYCILMEGGAWSIYLFIMNYGWRLYLQLMCNCWICHKCYQMKIIIHWNWIFLSHNKKFIYVSLSQNRWKNCKSYYKIVSNSIDSCFQILNNMKRLWFPKVVYNIHFFVLFFLSLFSFVFWLIWSKGFIHDVFWTI